MLTQSQGADTSMQMTLNGLQLAYEAHCAGFETFQLLLITLL